MTMKHIALAVAVLLVATVANAEIYQWKDKNGKTIISDKPPTENVVEQKKTASDPSTAGAATPKTAADRELEFRKRQKESQEGADKAKAEAAATTEKQENCVRARRYLTTLESGERVSLRDDKGERYFMDDAQREQETAKAKQELQANCK
jgi:hypothetical protein